MIERVHGIDRHKLFSTISVLNRGGEEVLFEGACREFGKYVEGLGPTDAVVLEASVVEDLCAGSVVGEFLQRKGSPGDVLSEGLSGVVIPTIEADRIVDGAFSARSSGGWDLQTLLDALRRQSEDVYQERNAVSDGATTAILHRIEAAVHGVDPGIRIGLMTCGCTTSRSLDAELGALRGGGADPLLRPGGGYWWDENILGALRKRIQIRSELPFAESSCESSYEMENYPYWPSLKSRGAIRMEWDLNILDGSGRNAATRSAPTMCWEAAGVSCSRRVLNP